MSDDQSATTKDQATDAGISSGDTTLGLNENFVGLLTYALGWVSGLVFLFIEKDNSFVRFHAIQSVVVFAALMAVTFVLGTMSILGGVLSTLVGIGSLFLWVFLMVQAYQGKRYKLPIVGEFAQRQLLNKGTK